MKASSLFSRTMRDAPSEAEMVSHQLLVRAGFIRQMASGIYSFLPLGRLALDKATEIIRQEMVALDGQEVIMPLVQPASLWRQSGRYDAAAPGPALVRFSDRSSHEMVLAMTHEEAATDLARQVIQSYRQLPLTVFQFQTKFRDEPRSRGGLVRVREFLMKDAYSFHADAASLDEFYPQMHAAYERILQRCDLDYVIVEAASGMMGGATSHEFMVLNEQGEDTLMICDGDACGYAANIETARLDKSLPPADQAPAPIERVATPGATTIASLAEYLGISTHETLKAVLYQTDNGRVIFCVIRGDLDISETKVSALLGDVDLKPASAESLAAAGIVPGYASPRGIEDENVYVIGDDSIAEGTNRVAGANLEGYHFVNVNYPRDFAADQIADIAMAREGDRCPRCGAPLAARRGIEVGHIFQLGTKYAELMGATYLDAQGRAQPLEMGCYGIGVGRLLACIVEQHHDDDGMVWPTQLAPLQIHLVALGGRAVQIDATALEIYQQLQQAGYTVLLDDRNERAGVKFNDADLIGLPIRLTVSQRSLAAGGVELKLRHEQDRRVVPLDELLDELATLVG